MMEGKSKRFTLQLIFYREHSCRPEYAYSEKQKVSAFTKGFIVTEYEVVMKHLIYQNPET